MRLPTVIFSIKTHGQVSVARKDVLHTSVLFTGTSNLRFSTPCVSVTAGLICTKFMHFMPFISTILHTQFDEN